MTFQRRSCGVFGCHRVRLEKGPLCGIHETDYRNAFNTRLSLSYAEWIREVSTAVPTKEK